MYAGIIWVTDSAKMGLLSYKNGGAKYLMVTIDVFTKYAWVRPSKIKKTKTAILSFIEMVKECKC